MNYKHYFEYNQIIKVDLLYHGYKPTLSELRKMGDYYNQYVVGVRYLDHVSLYEDNYEIYYYNSHTQEKLCLDHYYNYNCENCNNFIKNAEDNKIMYVHIYPKDKYPSYYKNRKNEWNKLRNEITNKKK